MSVVMHPERVKAEIRMRHRTLRRFAEAEGLNEEQVRDYLRGRSNTARDAVARLLEIDPSHLTLSRSAPTRGVRTAKPARAHRLCAGGK